MIKNEHGFTMTELLITMAVFVLTIAAATSIFVPLIGQFKQQSTIAEAQIEGAVGLDMLRRDIEQAGFGLPWNVPNEITTATYREASADPAPLTFPPSDYNDAPNPPRAIFSEDNVGLNGSDYLVVKATSVASHDAAMKWAYVVQEEVGGTTKSVIKSWGKNVEDLNPTDRGIVLIPSRGENNQRILVNNGGVFSVQFRDIPDSPFSPSTERDLYLVYGVDPADDLRMPFNRADYYLTRNGVTIPPRCAPGTGILVKSLIRHSDGKRDAGIPIVDCVADFQVVFGVDNDDDGDFELGTGDGYSGDISGLTAAQVRQRVKEARVYILAHEGQKDLTYDATSTYPDGKIRLPAAPDPAASLGNTFDFDEQGVTDWRHYRWKVYRMVVKPNNLR